MTDAIAPSLCPRLVCDEPDAAIEFYQYVFGARLLERFARPDGVVVHAALELFGAVFSVTQSSDGNRGPDTRSDAQGPVLLQLTCPDPDSVQSEALERGAEVIIPVADQFYGRREGRLVDPFGHCWIIGRETEKLSDAEIQSRLDDS